MVRDVIEKEYGGVIGSPSGDSAPEEKCKEE